MNNAANSSVEKWIAYTAPSAEARLRLFCFPFAGGGASTYRTWPEKLPPSVDVCPIQIPGRETRIMEQPYSSLEELLPVLADVLQPYLDRPFAFFGHSMGALIAFELTRWLRRSGGLSPELLIVSGHQSPPRPNKLPPIHHLGREEFIAGLRRFKFTPEPVLQNAELLELLLPALRADFSLYERYQFAEEAPLGCPLVALGALHDELVDQEDLEAWREHTSASFSAHIFPGDHFYLYTAQESVLRTVSEELMLRLAEVDA